LRDEDILAQTSGPPSERQFTGPNDGDEVLQVPEGKLFWGILEPIASKRKPWLSPGL